MTLIKQMHTDTNDRIFVFDQKGDLIMLHAELTKDKSESETPNP